MDNTPPSRAYKSTNGGFAVSLSACDDKQIAADTTVSFRIQAYAFQGVMRIISFILIINTAAGLYRKGNERRYDLESGECLITKTQLNIRRVTGIHSRGD